MSDMFVKLYTLPPLAPKQAQLHEGGVDIRRVIVAEKFLVVTWVRQTFGPAWASECEISFAHQPPSCYIATQDKQVIGFACYDTACKNFFGPTGVAQTFRERGIGTALLLACLHNMAANGYAYAIIGAAGPTDFYAKTVGAVKIEGSIPGIYRGMLREEVGNRE